MDPGVPGMGRSWECWMGVVQVDLGVLGKG